MDSAILMREFVKVLKSEFPAVQYRYGTLPSGGRRISPYVKNDRRDKRWMQIDEKPLCLSIVMDHVVNDIKPEDLKDINLVNGINKLKSYKQIEENQDSLRITILINDPYDFSNIDFIAFLHKHYASYLKRIQ